MPPAMGAAAHSSGCSVCLKHSAMLSQQVENACLLLPSKRLTNGTLSNQLLFGFLDDLIASLN